MIEDIDLKRKVFVFSDGGWWRKRGCGAWAYVIHYTDSNWKSCEKCHAQTADRTTNQRMEMIGMIMGLREVPQGAKIIAITDSKYLQRGMTEWIAKWKQRNWLTIEGEPVKNKELWVELDRLNQLHDIKWKWTKGHGGSEGNTKADLLVRNIMAETYGDSISGHQQPNNNSAKG